uniref:EF-hand domain-containing protein n=1 Tax=Eptatretus burgeri TaxID=7764 RepID=A0A8C4QRQ8_EPTBU
FKPTHTVGLWHLKIHTCNLTTTILSNGYKMATRLETAMDTLISVFHSYAGQQGDKYKVNIVELNKMVDAELPGLRKKNKDPKFVKSMLDKIDIDKNGEVDFKEFMSLIAAITLSN